MFPQSENFLRKCVKNIVKGFHPKRIVLFGSHAYGRPHRDSDLDLLVVKNTRLPFAERVRRVDALIASREMPLDIIVLTPSEIKRRQRDFDPFLDEVFQRGRVMYG